MSTTPPTRPYYPQIDKSIDPKATRHFQNLYTASNDHDQAIIKLNTKILALQKSLAAAAGTSTNTNTSTIVIENGFPGQGMVNDQSGNAAYTLQTGDNGVLLILSDASPVAVSLNSTVTPPYYFIAQNWGGGLVTFTPTSPATVNYIGNLGATSMPLAEGYETLMVWDGSDWWATTLPQTASALDFTQSFMFLGA